MACIYQIKNLINNKIYIGSTIRQTYVRKYEHFSELKNNKHCNSHLQNSFNKHGQENFSFTIVEEFKFPKNYTKILQSEYITGREFYLIEVLNAEYNIRRDTSTGKSGYTHSEETRKKISIANVTLTPSKKTLEKREREQRRINGILYSKERKLQGIPSPLKGRKLDLATIEKIKLRANQEDNKIRIREIQKIASTNRIGTHHSKETKLKMMNTKFGKNRTIEVYDKNNILVHTCSFSTEASILTGVKRATIANNLAGLSKSAGGFIFKYKI